MSTALLKTDGLSAGYHGRPAIRDISIEVASGEVVALLGANGAGKTTLVNTIAGQLNTLSGTTFLDGIPAPRGLRRRAGLGVGLLSERRCVFMGLTGAENLRLGRGDPELALEHFPELRDKLSRKAGLLSGGEQQMLALARILAAKPRLLLADELSMGLAPLVVQRLMTALHGAARDGAAVLVVEQHVNQALTVADRVYVLRRGEIVVDRLVHDITPERLTEYYL